jgi:hypothetical protein
MIIFAGRRPRSVCRCQRCSHQSRKSALRKSLATVCRNGLEAGGEPVKRGRRCLGHFGKRLPRLISVVSGGGRQYGNFRQIAAREETWSYLLQSNDHVGSSRIPSQAKHCFYFPSRLVFGSGAASFLDQVRRESKNDQPQVPAWLLMTSTLIIVASAIGMIWAFLTIKPWN